MMKSTTLHRYCLLAIIIIACIHTALSQSQSSVAVVGRVTSNYNLANITQPGGQSTSIIDNSLWLNYNAKRNPNEPFFAITVSLASGTIPPGIAIFVQAGEDVGAGTGRAGRTTGSVQLSYTPTAIIVDIGNTNTGSGKNKGHLLTISIIVNDFTQLQSADYNLNLVYTLQYQ